MNVFLDLPLSLCPLRCFSSCLRGCTCSLCLSFRPCLGRHDHLARSCCTHVFENAPLHSFNGYCNAERKAPERRQRTGTARHASASSLHLRIADEVLEDADKW
eukprot:SAG31_NODE_244_length_19246_cov_20.233823_6_plen_103_part_00